MKKKCSFCGEKEGIKDIPSPNMDDTLWKVCDTCAKAIPQMQKLSMGYFLKDYDKRKGFNSKVPDKIIREARKELRKIK